MSASLRDGREPMKVQLVQLSYDIGLSPGEELRLPSRLAAAIGPGRWRGTLEPANGSPARDHSAFLQGYAPEDERLYDEDSAD